MEVVVFVIVVLAVAGWWGGRHSTGAGTPAPRTRRPGPAPYAGSAASPESRDDAFITGYMISRHAYGQDHRGEREQDLTLDCDGDDDWGDDCFDD